MSEKCANLSDLFGDRFKIDFDPVIDSHGRQRDKIDPWLQVMRCERGEIYPFGDDKLAVEVQGRPITARRLAELDCCKVYQNGDHEVSFIFPVKRFEEVAAIVRPRKRRRLSEEQKHILAEASAPYRFKSRCLDRSQDLRTSAETT